MASGKLNSTTSNRGQLPKTKVFLILAILIFSRGLIHCSKKKQKALPRHISKKSKLRAAEKYLSKAKKQKKSQKNNSLIRAARLQIETNNFKQAEKTLNHLLKTPAEDKRNLARALYLLARIAPKNKTQKYLKVIKKYPDTVAAIDSLYFLIKQWKSTFTSSETLDKLRRLQKSNGINNLADNIAFAIAKFSEQLFYKTKNHKYLNISIKNYKKIWFDFKKSPLRDDALYNHALFLIKLKKLKKALIVLDVLLDTKEKSWIFGNYNSEFLDNALFKKGQIFLKLKKYKSAIKIFSSFSDRFKTSRLNDDAAFELIKLYALTNQPELKCKYSKRFLNNHKNSRYLSRVKTLSKKCAD
ncbi:MAG: tetratricopeptide repeat protein [Myxococcota bacterium]